MDEIFKVLKEKKCQMRILYPQSYSSKVRKKLTLSDKQKQRKFVINSHDVQEILK